MKVVSDNIHDSLSCDYQGNSSGLEFVTTLTSSNFITVVDAAEDQRFITLAAREVVESSRGRGSRERRGRSSIEQQYAVNCNKAL